MCVPLGEIHDCDASRQGIVLIGEMGITKHSRSGQCCRLFSVGDSFHYQARGWVIPAAVQDVHVMYVRWSVQDCLQSYRLLSLYGVDIPVPTHGSVLILAIFRTWICLTKQHCFVIFKRSQHRSSKLTSVIKLTTSTALAAALNSSR